MSTTAPGSPILIYVILGLIFSFGLLLLIFGLLGKRIDNHPWCRKCKFDLIGRAQDAERTCPECGNDLSKAKAIRIGQRRKRRGMLIIGALFFVIGLAGLGVKGYTDAAQVDWQQHKPVWWLMREANGTPGTNSDDALEELLLRYDEGSLSATDIGVIIKAALKHQADHTRPWHEAWGDFVELGRNDGYTTDQQWQQYAEQILSEPFTIEIRPRVTLDSKRLPIQITPQPRRIGRQYWLHFWFDYHDIRITINEMTYEIERTSGGSALGQIPTGLHIWPTDEQWGLITPGKQTVYVTMIAKLQYEGEEKAPATSYLHLEQEVEFLPAGQSSVQLINNPALKRQVEGAIQLEHIYTRRDSSYKKPNRSSLDIDFDIAPTPIDLAFDIVVRDEGHEQRVGALWSAAGTRGYTANGTSIERDLTGKKIDLVLRPSIRAAEREVEYLQIWGEEVVFNDVLVEEER